MTIGAKATLSARTGVSTDLDGGMVYSGKPAQPIRDDMKLSVLTRRLPQLFDRVKTLEAALTKAPEDA